MMVSLGFDVGDIFLLRSDILKEGRLSVLFMTISIVSFQSSSDIIKYFG